MINFVYSAGIEQDEAGFFLVTFRDFPFAATDGKTLHEAMEAATDCLEEAIASYVENGEDIPVRELCLAGHDRRAHDRLDTIPM